MSKYRSNSPVKQARQRNNTISGVRRAMASPGTLHGVDENGQYVKGKELPE